MNIPIFLSSDDNYSPFVATTIASICDNTKSFIDFYVLDSGISEQNKKKIEELKQSFSNFSIEFIKVDTKKYFKNIDYNNTSKYVSISTYNRFLIPYVKPQLNKVIYLDVDIIANMDISELFNIDLGNFSIGAVVDGRGIKDPLILRCKRNLKLAKVHDYFNAGVLLINAKKLKEENILHKVFETEQKYRNRLELADQDILNVLYDGNNYKKLDKKFNTFNELAELTPTNKICHFSGFLKPWFVDQNLETDNRIPVLRNKNLFWKYAIKTVFYNDLISKIQYKDNISLRKYLVFELLLQKAKNENASKYKELK